MSGLDDLQAQITVTKGTAMAAEHWFDTVNKLLAHGVPRRGAVSTIAALMFGQRLTATHAGGPKNDKRKEEEKAQGQEERQGQGARQGRCCPVRPGDL